MSAIGRRQQTSQRKQELQIQKKICLQHQRRRTSLHFIRTFIDGRRRIGILEKSERSIHFIFYAPGLYSSAYQMPPKRSFHM